MSPPPFLPRLILRNFKSIAACDIELSALTFLVGPNGSGKSNLLDSLRFVADALRSTLDHALRERGGINEVRRRSSGHPTHFGIRLEFALRDGTCGYYAFEIGAKPRGGFAVKREECEVRGTHQAFYRVEDGQQVLPVNASSWPTYSPDRLFLVAVSGRPEFRPLYDALSHMLFYSLNPESMRELQPFDSGEALACDGSNATGVLRRLNEVRTDRKERVEHFLSKVVPGIRGVEPKTLGPRETLEFSQDVAGAANPWRFLAGNMSDGTLRALGILLSLFQPGNGVPIPLVGMEEPEIALHPAAAGVLFDALRESSRETQVLVASHSPDLLDLVETGRERILAVHAEKGTTHIGPIDSAAIEIVRQGLYTPGELLRLGQLEPQADLFGPGSNQPSLFGGEALE